MRYFKYETDKKKLNVYPFVCWHIGSPQADIGFIKEMVKRVEKDPDAVWIYLGDGGECATKMSKGDVYTQTMSPMAQQNELVRLLEPVKGKGLFGVKGNHGNRIYKETGLDFDETLCAKLGLPYLDVSAFWHLRLGISAEPVTFSIFSTHGVDSGVSLGSKVLAGQKFDRTMICDAIITAHSHVAMDLPPRYYSVLADTRRSTDPIVWKETNEYICGSAYDSRGGYAEEKGYPPILPSHLCITFSIGRDSKDRRVGKQSCQIFRVGEI